jgi:chromosome segregation and condensation protein ScpB
MRQQVVDNVLQEQQARAADLRRQKAAVAEAKDGLRRKNLETGKQMRMDLTEKQKQAELERQSYSERGRELVEAEKAWQSFRREKYSPQSTPCPSPREPSTAIRP